jgi:hypothetical protein
MSTNGQAHGLKPFQRGLLPGYEFTGTVNEVS